MQRSNKIKLSKGEKIFSVFNYIFLGLIALITLLPFLNVAAKSLSSESAVISGAVSFWPVGIQFGTYAYVLKDQLFLNSFKSSLFITLMGTLLSTALTALTAYPLAQKGLRGRKMFMLMFVFSMLFNGGMIPNYLLIKSLGLMENLWAIILPSMINVFNLLVIKSYFEDVPEAIYEAAKIDGASNFRIFYAIVLPISLPVLATIVLFYAVYYWNDYFNAMLYITKPAMKPLQLYLYELITQSQNLKEGLVDVTQATNLTGQSIRAASIMISTLPILISYPLLQKYFVKGMVIGAVKG